MDCTVVCQIVCQITFLRWCFVADSKNFTAVLINDMLSANLFAKMFAKPPARDKWLKISKLHSFKKDAEKARKLPKNCDLRGQK